MISLKKKRVVVPMEAPVDLSARIGARTDGDAPTEHPTPAVPALRRHDGPVDPVVRSRAVVAGPVPSAASNGRPTMIGLEEVASRAAATGAPSAPTPQPTDLPDPIRTRSRAEALPAAAAPEPPLVSVRESPAFGEIDLVATPLPTPDDWHHFELALRKLRGIGELRTEYYRAGVLKVRVRWSGADRFANAIRSVPGYRVRILGEDRSTVQVLIGRA